MPLLQCYPYFLHLSLVLPLAFFITSLPPPSPPSSSFIFISKTKDSASFMFELFHASLGFILTVMCFGMWLRNKREANKETKGVKGTRFSEILVRFNKKVRLRYGLDPAF